MRPRRWDEVQAVFDELIALDAADRASRLASLGATDPDLRAAVEPLLAADAQAEARLALLDAAFIAQAAATPDPFGLAGRTVSHFRVLEPLGAGGMGVVYRAEDIRLGRTVALKFLLPQLEMDAAATTRFLQEARSAAKLDHPNLCTIHEVGESEDGRPFLAMALYPGETLKARLEREGPLPLDEAIAIARQIAEGLACAHAAGIVHRDLKPGNVMLVRDGPVKILDFGLAKALDQSLSTSSARLGTPLYMAPEQVQGEAVDARTDLWALGVVLYEMLTGRTPFGREHEGAVVYAILVDEPTPPTSLRVEVPARVEELVLTLLHKDPVKRYSAAHQLLPHLVDVGTSVGPAVRSASARWLRGRRILSGKRLSMGVVGVVAVSVTAALLVRRSGVATTGATSRVVVLPFENRTSLTELHPLGPMVAEWLTQGLIELPFLTVLDTRGAQTAARTLGAGAAPTAVGRETAADIVVAGSYLLQDDSLQFLAQISSTTNGTVLVGISGVTGPRDHPLDGVERLRQRVLAAFAALHDKDVSTFQTTLAQPPTYASYREYVEGLESYMGGGAGLGAAERFQRAAVLDTTFLAARIWAAQAGLTLVYRMDQVWGRRVDSLISGLMLIRHRLTPFDRARLDFVVALRDGSFLEQYRAALRLLDAAPGSVDARREVALTALRVLRPREALRRLDEIDPGRGLLREWDGYWFAAAWAHHLLGQHGDELTVVRRGRRQHASSPDFLYVELRALAALGRTAELDSLMRVELPGFSGQAALIAFGIAGELMAHGHAEAAQLLARYAFDHPVAPPLSEAAASAWLERHILLRGEIGDPWCFLGGQLDRRSPAERARDEWLHWRAELALLLGDVETAATVAAELRDPAMHDLLVARILAAQGKPDAAHAALERGEVRVLQAQGTIKFGDFCVLEMNRASVLVRLGDLEKAIEVLSKALRGGAFTNAWWGQDGHAYPDLAPLWGDPRFRALIKPRG